MLYKSDLVHAFPSKIMKIDVMLMAAITNLWRAHIFIIKPIKFHSNQITRFG